MPRNQINPEEIPATIETKIFVENNISGISIKVTKDGKTDLIKIISANKEVLSIKDRIIRSFYKFASNVVESLTKPSVYASQLSSLPYEEFTPTSFNVSVNDTEFLTFPFKDKKDQDQLNKIIGKGTISYSGSLFGKQSLSIKLPNNDYKLESDGFKNNAAMEFDKKGKSNCFPVILSVLDLVRV